MKYETTARWVTGLSLAAALASMHCGGDDTTGTGPVGSGGTSSATGGRGGAAGSADSSASGGGGAGGTMGAGARGGAAGATGSGGRGGSGGGTGGTGGTPGTGGVMPEGGPDSAVDAPGADASDDMQPEGAVSDGPALVPFSDVIAIFNDRCVTCHQPRDGGVQLLDLQTPSGLYARLTTPLPDNQDGTCGMGADAGVDGGDASPPNRVPIVPGDTSASFLYAKITGNQVPGTPPVGCGARMPRVTIVAADGGVAGTVGCDQADGGQDANCLTQDQMNLIRDWITQGAQEFSPEN